MATIVLKSLNDALPSVKQKLIAYLPNVNTRKDLTSAIKANLIEIYKEFLNFVQYGYSSAENEQLQTSVTNLNVFIALLDEQLSM